MDGYQELTPEFLKTPEGITALNRMLQVLFENAAGDGNSVKVYTGIGVPTIAAGAGSLFLRTDGTAGASVYAMEGTTWTAL